MNDLFATLWLPALMLSGALIAVAGSPGAAPGRRCGRRTRILV